MQAPSPRDSLVVVTPRCHACGQLVGSSNAQVGMGLHTGVSNSPQAAQQHRRASERFIKPAIPAPQPASPMDTSTKD